MKALTDGGVEVSRQLRALGRAAAPVVAAIYPSAVSACVILTLSGRAIARVVIPVGPALPAPVVQPSHVWLDVKRGAVTVFPDASKITVLIELPDDEWGNKREAWLPVVSSGPGGPPSPWHEPPSVPPASSSTSPRA